MNEPILNSMLSPSLAFFFLSPWFFTAGLLLATVPIIIHILNRRRFKTVTWAAMEFLLRAMRKNRRRLRFEQWLLLATRCLLLVLLGAALARPLGCENGALAALGRHTALDVFVIDNSYSMSYEANHPGAKTHLQQAKRIAKAMLDQPSSGGVSVAVITAARPARAIIAKPGYDIQAAKAAIDRIEQSYGATDLAGALQEALQIARDESRQPNKNLYVLTDATRSAFEGSQNQALKELGPELAKVFRLTHRNLAEGQPQWNGAITALRPSEGLVTNRFQSDFKASIAGFGGLHEGTLQWKLDEQNIDGPDSAKLDGIVNLTQSKASFATGGPHVLSVTLIDQDRLPADNTFWRVVDVASELKTLVVEGKHGINRLEGSAAFIMAALDPRDDAGKSSTESYVAPDLISDLELGGKPLNDYRLVILADVSQVTADEAETLRHFVEQGGTLMYFMGDLVNKESYNAVLLPRKLLPGPLVKMVSVGAEQRGYTLDFRPNGVLHPFLHAFADQEDTGLDKAQVFTYWQVDVPPASGIETVLKYVSRDTGSTGAKAGGDPAITHQTLGQGHIVFVSTLANHEWTNFPGHPNYLSLIHELVQGSTRTGDYWMNLMVGERLVIPSTVKLGGAPTLSDPQDRAIVLQTPNPESTKEYERNFHSEPIARPGVYKLSLGGPTVPIAVNVPAEDEANVFVISNEAVRHALGDINVTLRGAEMPAETVADAKEGNDFSWWCMAGVLMLVGFECLMAMRFGHYRRSERGEVKATQSVMPA